MKKLLSLGILLCVPALHAVTVKSDFLRVAQSFANPSFPLEIPGYLDLRFVVMVTDESNPDGVEAIVERRWDEDLVSSYTGFFAYGVQKAIEFPNGAMGPKLTILKSE